MLLLLLVLKYATFCSTQAEIPCCPASCGIMWAQMRLTCQKQQQKSANNQKYFFFILFNICWYFFLELYCQPMHKKVAHILYEIHIFTNILRLLNPRILPKWKPLCMNNAHFWFSLIHAHTHLYLYLYPIFGYLLTFTCDSSNLIWLQF